MSNQNNPFVNVEEVQRRDAVEAMKILLGFPPGREVIRHLFRMGGVGTLPDDGLLPDFLRSEIGKLKLGREIYQLVSEADHQQAALILSDVEKERQNGKV